MSQLAFSILKTSAISAEIVPPTPDLMPFAAAARSQIASWQTLMVS
jgi:hypothetical protein